MSIKVMSAVWECEGLDAAERLVMLSLADHADDEGTCYPSIARLCLRTSMSDRGVQKVMARLIERGFLAVEINAGKRGANLYRITATPERRSPPNDVHPRTTFTPPPNVVRITPEPGSPEPLGTIKEPSEDKKAIAATLEAWASPEAVASFMAYRRKMKGKALTLTAAKRLATHLAAIFNVGGDPSDALGLAEERGWVSVEAEWYFRERSKQHGNGNRISGTSQGPKRVDPALEQIARLAGLGAAPGNGRGGIGSPGEEDGSLWLGARPQ